MSLPDHLESIASDLEGKAAELRKMAWHIRTIAEVEEHPEVPADTPPSGTRTQPIRLK